MEKLEKKKRIGSKKKLAAASQKKKKKPAKEVVPTHEVIETSDIPNDIPPMLATLADAPLNEDGWIYEVKWDGFRVLSYLKNGKPELRSRNNKVFNDKFYPLYNEFSSWNINAVLDGEVIVVNEHGMADFDALQTWRSEADGELMYYVFDILWWEGKNLLQVPLVERRKILQQIIPKKGMVRISESFNVQGAEFFALAEELNLEGIIAKKEDSIYQPGIRSKEWLKIKTIKHQEAVIGGYTRNENSSKLFSALLMGIYENDELIPITPVGTGFSLKVQREILDKLKPLETNECPFAVVPDYNKPSRFRPNPPKAEVTWVKPIVVAEFTYRTVTSDGAYRHPSFKGLREDKSPADVQLEVAIPATELMEENELLKQQVLKRKGKQERKTFLNPADETQVRNVHGHDLKFTNLGKIFWPDDKVSKRDMLNYYYQAAPFILPYLEDRPQTLNRFPNGIHGKSFYQKDVTGKVPEWIDQFEYYSEADERLKHFLICTDEASLLYIANMGCIEINPWSSRKKFPNHPDWCIIDLDPDQNTFEQVIEAARVTKQVLDAIGVPGFCKTSGSTGLHIYIPLGAMYTYEDSKEFGRALVKVVHGEIPEFTTIERYTSKRNGKMYLDFLQNRPQATVAAPYSLRPKPGATVSMPLHWEEVKKGLKMKDFTIHNAIARMKEQGDIFKGVLGRGIDMEKALKKIHSL